MEQSLQKIAPFEMDRCDLDHHLPPSTGRVEPEGSGDPLIIRPPVQGECTSIRVEIKRQANGRYGWTAEISRTHLGWTMERIGSGVSGTPQAAILAAARVAAVASYPFRESANGAE